MASSLHVSRQRRFEQEGFPRASLRILSLLRSCQISGVVETRRSQKVFFYWTVLSSRKAKLSVENWDLSLRSLQIVIALPV